MSDEVMRMRDIYDLSLKEEDSRTEVLVADLRAVLDRLEAAEYDRDFAQGEMECQRAAKDQLRARLESAERVIQASFVFYKVVRDADCGPAYLDRARMDFFGHLDAHVERFGGRADE